MNLASVAPSVAKLVLIQAGWISWDSSLGAENDSFYGPPRLAGRFSETGGRDHRRWYPLDTAWRLHEEFAQQQELARANTCKL